MVPLAVRSRVAADEVLGGELGQVILDAHGAVVRAQGPQQRGEDCGLVPEAAVVVGLGDQADEGALGGEGDCGEGLGGQGFRLDGSDAGLHRLLQRGTAADRRRRAPAEAGLPAVGALITAGDANA
ncbi:hypothetical protein ACIP46_02770 [Streptomyces lavendulae]|uniref:hypothetical protein n=1 Tax=Streptomyces lavendulae TaxID=1914 RepID=UPI0038068CF4